MIFSFAFAALVAIVLLFALLIAVFQQRRTDQLKRSPHVKRPAQKTLKEPSKQSSTSANTTGGTGAVVSEALKVELRQILAQDLYINAIKRVREETGLGLAEAKRYVDSMVNNGGSVKNANDIR